VDVTRRSALGLFAATVVPLTAATAAGAAVTPSCPAHFPPTMSGGSVVAHFSAPVRSGTAAVTRYTIYVDGDRFAEVSAADLRTAGLLR
jgi:hypothetical protein